MGTAGAVDAYALLVQRATVPVATEAEIRAAKMARQQEMVLAEAVLPGVLDDQGYPRDRRARIAGGGIPKLFFVGYQIAATGHLREIGLEAQATAAELAPGS